MVDGVCVETGNPNDARDETSLFLVFSAAVAAAVSLFAAGMFTQD